MENVIKRAFGELDNIFQDDFNKILSKQSKNVRFFLSHNWIQHIKLENKGQKHTHLAMFWNFCVGWSHEVNIWTMQYMTSWNLISHVLEKRKFVMAVLHWKQGLLCDNSVFHSYFQTHDMTHTGPLYNHFNCLLLKCFKRLKFQKSIISIIIHLK